MSDKTNVDDIIGLVKTDEVIDGVEEVRKLRGRGEKMSNLNENDIVENQVEEKIMESILPKQGDIKFMEQWYEYNEKHGWLPIPTIDVPLDHLLMTWEDLIGELHNLELGLLIAKEQYSQKEFEIVYQSDIDFKALYGSTSEKVRKQHAANELVKLKDKIDHFELSINWIKGYIPLLKEVIRSKQ